MSTAPNLISEVCSAVLVGGKSRRLGKEKSLIPLAGKPLIDWVLESLSQVFARIILVGRKNPELEKRAELIEDLFPGLGPISGIYTALEYLKKPVFICACDMPFLNPRLIRYQVSLLNDFDVVVPCPGGFFEPLHSIYTPACLKPLKELIEKGKRRPVEIFPCLRVRKITEKELASYDPQFLPFFNINTYEDLKQAEKILQNKFYSFKKY